MRAGFALRFQVVGELASQSCPRLRACDLSTAKCPWPTLVMCGISGFFPGRPVTQRLSTGQFQVEVKMLGRTMLHIFINMPPLVGGFIFQNVHPNKWDGFLLTDEYLQGWCLFYYGLPGSRRSERISSSASAMSSQLSRTLVPWNAGTLAAGLQSWVTLQGSTGRVWKGSSMVRSGPFPSNRWFQCLLLEPAQKWI